jgi:hypothetical protein
MQPENASNVVKISPGAQGSDENALNPESAQNKQKMFAEFDALGEDNVRLRLASSFYDRGDRSAVVLEWLRSKVESEAPEVRAAGAAERIAAAAERHAKAEERQAKAAVRARNRATIALILAAFSSMGFVALLWLVLTE